eukprot:gene8534-61973_t
MGNGGDDHAVDEYVCEMLRRAYGSGGPLDASGVPGIEGDEEPPAEEGIVSNAPGCPQRAPSVRGGNGGKARKYGFKAQRKYDGWVDEFTDRPFEFISSSPCGV